MKKRKVLTTARILRSYIFECTNFSVISQFFQEENLAARYSAALRAQSFIALRLGTITLNKRLVK
jgi:hypothetical protein